MPWLNWPNVDHVRMDLHVNAPIAYPSNLRAFQHRCCIGSNKHALRLHSISHSLKFGHESSCPACSHSAKLVNLPAFPISGCSKRGCQSQLRRFSQGNTFGFCSRVGQSLRKKSLASTTKAADKISRKRPDFEGLCPKKALHA